MKRIALLLALLCSTSQAAIQTHHERIPEFGATATLRAPDPAQADESFRIESGQTVTISGMESVKDIYVNGFGDQPAILELTDGCELRVQTILLAGPNAVLRTPPGQAVSCRVVWRDLPFDLVNDPQQFSNGLVVVSGQVLLSGESPRQSKAEVVQEIRAGHTSITVRGPPTNWQAGDRLWIPDGRQSGVGSQAEWATIASIDQNIVTLIAPVRWDHKGRYHQDGSLDRLYEIGNVTQSVVFQSENPNGIRGHFLAVDHCLVEWDGVSFVDMCRTTTAPLHNTTFNPDGTVQRIGQNQIGKYIHFHGMPGRADVGEWQFSLKHFSIIGSPKLGLVLHHSTHFGLISDFIILNCAGSGFTTETPNIYGCRLEYGMIDTAVRGSGERITSRNNRNFPGGDHWHGGVGLGLQSAMIEIHDVSVYGYNVGVGMAGFRTTTLFKPTMRGVHTDTPGTRTPLNPGNATWRYPFLPSSDMRVWGCFRGIETWTADCFENTERMFPGMEIVHCPHPTDFQDQEETYLEDWEILGDFSQVVIPTSAAPPANYALSWKDAYRFGITVQGGRSSGYPAVYKFVHDRHYTRFIEHETECPCVLYQPLGEITDEDCVLSFENCTFNRVAGHLQAINSWDKYSLDTYYKQPIPRPNQPSLNSIKIQMRPWEDGRMLNIYHREQHPDYARPPITATQGYGDWPLGVSTNAQLIDLGTPIYGEEIPPSAVQEPETFGRFYYDDVTLELRLQSIEARLTELENAE